MLYIEKAKWYHCPLTLDDGIIWYRRLTTEQQFSACFQPTSRWKQEFSHNHLIFFSCLVLIFLGNKTWYSVPFDHNTSYTSKLFNDLKSVTFLFLDVSLVSIHIDSRKKKIILKIDCWSTEKELDNDTNKEEEWSLTGNWMSSH